MLNNPQMPIINQSNTLHNNVDITHMLKMIISPFSQLKPAIKRYNPSHMLTLLSPNSDVFIEKNIQKQNHTILFFNDINEPRPKLIAPQMQDVEKIITAAQQWYLEQCALYHASIPSPIFQFAPLLIHCQMGISRSTAAAYIIACALNPSIDEEAFAICLRKLSPSATPNARLIALADDYLKRNGKMIAAIKRIGRGAEAREGTPFILPLALAK